MIAPTAPVRKITNSTRRKQKIPESPIKTLDPEEEEEEEEEEDEEEAAEDESVTRCLCGESHNIGLMVCCDQCEVWQHCECMGLEEDEIPDQYYCELCRPADHIEVKSYERTRRYYKPVNMESDKRMTKRRTTFNSREASISLEEVLAFRNAIEQSKTYDSSGMEILKSASPVQVQHYDAMHAMKENITILQNYEDVHHHHHHHHLPLSEQQQSQQQTQLQPQQKQKQQQQQPPKQRPKRAAPKKSLSDELKPAKKEKKTRQRYTPRSSSSTTTSPSTPGRRQNKASRSRTSTPQPDTQQQQEEQQPSSCGSQLFEHFSQSARETSPPAKVRMPSHRMTIAEMNKRASHILEYICSMQVELATKRNRRCYDSDNEDEEDYEEERRQLVDAQINQAMTGAGTDDDDTHTLKQHRRPTPILIPGKLDHSSPSSSLSSASTLPLDHHEDHYREKSVAQQAIDDSMKPKSEQSSMEIMDILTRKVITFQRRFGSLNFSADMVEEEDGPVTRSREAIHGRSLMSSW